LIGAGVLVVAGADGAAPPVFDASTGFAPSTGLATAGVVTFGASTCFPAGALVAGCVGLAAVTGAAGFAAGVDAVVGAVTGLAASTGLVAVAAGEEPCANAEPAKATDIATAAMSDLDIWCVIPCLLIFAAIDRLAARRDAFMRHRG